MRKFLFKRKDGGQESTVTGYWLFEFKNWFSVCLLYFDEGSREAFHSHAFNAYSWYLSGEVVEHTLVDRETKKVTLRHFTGLQRWFKYTPKHQIHKVFAIKPAWVITFRGPWSNTWEEYLPDTDKFITLTHGRIRV